MSQLQVTGEAKIRDIQGPVVANNGVVTALDGAASQYVRGDGTLADFPTSSGGGSSVSYYLNSSVSQGTIGGVAYRQLSKEPIIGAGTDITISANGYVANYLTDANDPDVILVPGGNFNCEFYFSVNNNTGNPTTYAELYKYDGTTFTLLGSSVGVPESINQGTTIAPYYFAIPVATATLALTDRLAIRIYVNVDGRTVTLHTENSHLCQVVTTLSKGMVSLNNLTDQSQFITTGTSGTDFNIVSSGDTHTFNIPSASASNRGLITTGTQTIAGQKTFNATLFGTDAEFSGSILSPIISILDSSTYTKVVRLQTLAATNRDVYFPDLNGTVALLEGTQTFSGGKTFTGSASFNSSLGNSPIFSYGAAFIKGNTPSATSASWSQIYAAAGNNNIIIADSSNTSTLQFQAASSYTYTFPAASGTIALTNSSTNQTFSNNNIFSGTANFTSTLTADTGILLKNAAIFTASGYLGLGGLSNGLRIGFNGGFTSDFILNTSANYVYTFPASSGTLALTSNLSSYVPYTGATTNVDLGNYNLTASLLIANTYGGSSGSLILNTGTTGYSYNNNAITLVSSPSTAHSLVINSNASSINKTALLNLASLTSSRIYTLQDASGTIALTSDLSNYVPYTGATTNVDLGANNLTSQHLIANGLSGVSGTLQLKQNTSYAYSNGYTSFYTTGNNFAVTAVNSTGTSLYNAIFDLSATTSSRTFTLPTTSGTLVLGTGTTNYLPKFTGANTIGDSAISDNGTTLSFGRAATFSSSVTATSLFGGNSSLYGVTINNDTTNPIYGSNIFMGADAGTNQKAFKLTTKNSSSGVDFTISGSTTSVAYGGSTTGLTYSEFFRITNNGNVGIGTSSPNTTLTLQKSSMPTGYTTGDMYLHIGGANEVLNGTALIGFGYSTAAANYPPAYIGFLETVYDSYEKGALIFGTRDVTTNTQATERMRITSSGNVGIGTSIPSAKLQISNTSSGAATVAAFLLNESTTTNTEVRLAFAANTNNDISTNRYSYISALNTSGSNGQALLFATNETGNSAVERMRIRSDGNIFTNSVVYANTTATSANMFIFGSYDIGRSTSSARFKTQIEDIEQTYVNNIYNMKPKWYRSLCEKDNKDWSHFGFVAEEMAEIEPRLVHWFEEEDGTLRADGVQYDRITALLVKALQDQKNIIDELSAKVTALENK